jgi:3-oxoacyl-[acyl-carrier-protein] synthase III
MYLKSVAHVLPSRAVSNGEVIANLRSSIRSKMSEEDVETLVRLTQASFETAGTSTRYQLAEGEKPYQLCIAAGELALDRAGLAPADIDLIIYAGIGRGFIEPATANVFQHMLGLKNATCFDVIDACASWVRALDVAAKFLQCGGRYRNIMILNGEFIGRYAYRYDLASLDEFEHWFPGVTVGEAATATIVSRSDSGDDFAFDFRTWGEKRALCVIPMENYADYLGMDPPNGMSLTPLQFASFGGHIMRFGASKLVSHFRESPDFNTRDYDLVFGHAASDGICEAIGRRCGLDVGKFHYTHRLFGNTATASVPLAMSRAMEDGSMSAGSRILIMFASAGVSTALVRFQQPLEPTREATYGGAVEKSLSLDLAG